MTGTLHYNALYCTALHCAALPCTALCCTAQSFQGEAEEERGGEAAAQDGGGAEVGPGTGLYYTLYLKSAQEVVTEMERGKKELDQCFQVRQTSYCTLLHIVQFYTTVSTKLHQNTTAHHALLHTA